MTVSKLKHYYFNIFLTLIIGADKFRLLVSTHIQKMTASGITEFAPLIAEMQVEGDILNDILDKKTIDYAGRHTETTGKDESIVEFNEFANYLYNTAAAKFRTQPAKLTELFPQGVMYYTDATIAEFATRLTYLGTMITKYSGDLTPAIVAEFANIKLAIETTLALQLEFKSELGTGATDYSRQRVKVSKLLHKDTLIITAHHYIEPQLVENYFDQTIWETHSRDDKSISDYTLAPLTFVDTNASFIKSTKFEIINPNDFEVGYFVSAAPVTEIPSTYNTIAANSKVNTTGALLQAPLMKYIYFFNPSTDFDADMSLKTTQ